jgi:hypothetical protein
MAAFDTITTQLLDELAVCLNTALSSRPNPPGEAVCVIPGEGFQLMLTAGLLEDRCCSGFAAVRLAGLTPRDPQPGVYTPCGTLVWQADFEMGVARCYPFGTVNAGPSCQQMREVSDQVQSDLAAMIEAQCCFAAIPDVGGFQKVSSTAWLPFGPEGTCTGGIMGVSVLIDNCACPGGTHA